jgi:hypothetical protein
MDENWDDFPKLIAALQSEETKEYTIPMRAQVPRRPIVSKKTKRRICASPFLYAVLVVPSDEHFAHFFNIPSAQRQYGISSIGPAAHHIGGRFKAVRIIL